MCLAFPTLDTNRWGGLILTIKICRIMGSVYLCMMGGVAAATSGAGGQQYRHGNSVKATVPFDLYLEGIQKKRTRDAADRRRVEQALSNAARRSPESSTIGVSSVPEGVHTEPIAERCSILGFPARQSRHRTPLLRPASIRLGCR